MHTNTLQDSDSRSPIDPIQIIDPRSGRCMTWQDYGNDVTYSTMTFAPCNPAPKQPDQLFYAQERGVASALVSPIGPINAFALERGVVLAVDGDDADYKLEFAVVKYIATQIKK